jgi:hypothetical protein
MTIPALRIECQLDAKAKRGVERLPEKAIHHSFGSESSLESGVVLLMILSRRTGCFG